MACEGAGVALCEPATELQRRYKSDSSVITDIDELATILPRKTAQRSSRDGSLYMGKI